MNLFKIKLKTGRIIETDDEEVVKLYKNNPSTVNIIEANKNIVLYEQDDFKETNNHIGRVVVVKPKDDYLKSICICPRCGNVLHYEDLIMVDGSYW